MIKIHVLLLSSLLTIIGSNVFAQQEKTEAMATEPAAAEQTTPITTDQATAGQATSMATEQATAEPATSMATEQATAKPATSMATEQTTAKSASSMATEHATATPETNQASSKNYVCTHGNNVRRIEVDYLDQTNTVPCEVNYYKDVEEPNLKRTLWTAQADLGYCEQKALELFEKLQGFGWNCAAN